MKQSITALLLTFVTACMSRRQSALDPAGQQSERIADLWWFFLILLAVIFVVVMAAILYTLTRRHRGIDQEPLELTHMPSAETESRLKRVVWTASIASLLILIGLLIVSVSTANAISRSPGGGEPLSIEITGNQWWWYIRYLNQDPRQVVVTANEIHIPVGRPVLIRGMSNDVIHSLWIPNMQGKRDLIPSRVTSEWLRADQPGEFRGQCAEFCGLQHAHMALTVIAEPQPQFEAWMNQQTQGALPPPDPGDQHGQEVFLSHACVLCHAIQGTIAGGQVAPDLTHFGSRRTIGAGTLPNTEGNLAGWIADPQSAKPGTHMPTIPVSSEDMQPLAHYLESLK